MLHMMMDIYGCHNPKFNNLISINKLINDVCKVLELKPVAPPTLIPFYYGKVSEDDGISAFVLLEGGHFTIHTFYKRRCAFVDLLFDDFEGENLKRLLTKRSNVYKNGALVGEGVEISNWEIDRNCRSVFNEITEINKFKEGVENTFTAFGPHYFVTAQCRQPLTIEKIYTILDHMPKKAHMTPITRPFVLRDQVDDPEFLSGIVVIAESHISIHYDVAKNRLYFDMFTCRPLAANVMEGAFYDEFEKLIDKDTMNRALIERGRNHKYAARTSEKGSPIRKNWTKGTWIENIYESFTPKKK